MKDPLELQIWILVRPGKLKHHYLTGIEMKSRTGIEMKSLTGIEMKSLLTGSWMKIQHH